MDADKLHPSPQQEKHANNYAADARNQSRARLQKSVAWIERRMGVGGDEVWHGLKTRPFLGVASAATLGFGLAVMLGASELLVGVGAGYAAYLILQKGEPPSKAIEKAAKLGL